jgi:hypothetical protein
MTPLVREELIELGVSVPTGVLTDWASDQIAATKGRESRLEKRGVNAAYLSGIRDLIDVVKRGHVELGETHDLPPKPAALAERIRLDSMKYWAEAKRLVRVAFASQPDVLARFRTGVLTGRLLLNQVREIEALVVLLREYHADLKVLGVTEGFITRGEVLAARLREVKGELDDACRTLPPTAAQQCRDKGMLYDLTRRLVRIGRLEFQPESDSSSPFTFTRILGEKGVSTRPELKKTNRDA